MGASMGVGSGSTEMVAAAVAVPSAHAGDHGNECVTLPDLPGRSVPRASVQRCICTEDQVRLAFLIAAGTLGLVVVALVWYFWAMKQVHAWVKQKEELKCIVTHASERTAVLISSLVDERERHHRQQPPCAPHQMQAVSASQATAPHEAYDIRFDPRLARWMEMLETVALGPERNGFMFVMDRQGGVWAHGKNPLLALGCGNRREPGFHSLRGLDNPVQHSTPTANIVRTATKGGGFVYFRWNDCNMLLLSYVRPVCGTDLIVGGALPIPHSQRVWEETSMANADVDACHPRRPFGGTRR